MCNSMSHIDIGRTGGEEEEEEGFIKFHLDPGEHLHLQRVQLSCFTIITFTLLSVRSTWFCGSAGF